MDAVLGHWVSLSFCLDLIMGLILSGCHLNKDPGSLFNKFCCSRERNKKSFNYFCCTFILHAHRNWFCEYVLTHRLIVVLKVKVVSIFTSANQLQWPKELKSMGNEAFIHFPWHPSHAASGLHLVSDVSLGQKNLGNWWSALCTGAFHLCHC